MENTKQQTTTQPDFSLRGVATQQKIPTSHDKCISGDFSPEKFFSALQLLKLKSGKGLNPLCPKARANTPYRLCFEVLVERVPVYLQMPSKAFKIWRKAFVVVIPKPNKSLGDQSAIDLSLHFVSLQNIGETYLCLR